MVGVGPQTLEQLLWGIHDELLKQLFPGLQQLQRSHRHTVGCLQGHHQGHHVFVKLTHHFLPNVAFLKAFAESLQQGSDSIQVAVLVDVLLELDERHLLHFFLLAGTDVGGELILDDREEMPALSHHSVRLLLGL